MENKAYYLGLDIGTDSVGYAAADEQYRLRKCKGEPVWGVTLFEAASLAEERRAQRVARRRLDRRQQRAALLAELFAPEIGAIDPNFFLRRRESALFAADARAGVKLFDGGGLSDEAYHEAYPTIHHLICELMESEAPHDVRLVYIACAWLVTHRGHFLFDAADGAVDDFGAVYAGLQAFFADDCQCEMPWDADVSADTLLQILTVRAGVKRKQALFAERVYGGAKPAKKPDEDFPYSRDGIVTLLCGGKAAPKDMTDSVPDTDTDADTDTETGKPVGALTPDGNLTLIDDILQIEAEATEDTEQKEKQFITLQSKNGNYFYLVIDRSGDTENVYFLNLIDEADLMALINGDTVGVPTCSCTDKCVVGSIDTS